MMLKHVLNPWYFFLLDHLVPAIDPVSYIETFWFATYCTITCSTCHAIPHGLCPSLTLQNIQLLRPWVKRSLDYSPTGLVHLLFPLLPLLPFELLLFRSMCHVDSEYFRLYCYFLVSTRSMFLLQRPATTYNIRSTDIEHAPSLSVRMPDIWSCL